MRNEIENLLDDYKRRLKTAMKMRDDKDTYIETKVRLDVKASCYRTIISELEKILNSHD